jgi:hypothetical protein
MFDKMQDIGKNNILATTKWGSPVTEAQSRRERQLGEHWRGKSKAFLDTYESAWAIVDLVLEENPVDAAQIQKMLVNLIPEAKKEIKHSFAGRIIRLLFRRK